MSKYRRCAWTLAAVLLATGLAACAVPLQDHPQLIGKGRNEPSRTAEPDPTADSQTSTAVYLIRAGRLVRVVRPAPAGDRLNSTLSALLTGVRPAESAQQLRTAIPAAVAEATLRVDGDIAIVRVPDAFLELTGAEQVLAVAQLVWTVADGTEVTGLRFIDERSTPMAVPVEGGDLVYRPVRRSDYRAVGPS